MSRRNTYYEIRKIPPYKRVTAIDAKTGEEVIVQVSEKTRRPRALEIAYKALQKKLFPEDPPENPPKSTHDGDLDIIA